MRTGKERLKQLFSLRIELSDRQRVYDEDSRILIAEYIDGAREYVSRGSRYTSGKNSESTYRVYKKMLEVLEKEGIDLKKFGNRKYIDVETHTLVFPSGSIYQFKLPHRKYLDIPDIRKDESGKK